jgi:branched-chain amino acid transport system substrate-binding protein
MKKGRASSVLLGSFLILALAVLPFVAACTTQPAEPTQPAELIKIGGTLPLTGSSAENGKWIKLGYEYWAKQINAKGGLLGRPVELIIYDDESNPNNGVTLLEKAITVDKVNLIIGGYPGNTAAAQMAVAEQYKMVYVSMGGHMASFSQGFQYSFSATPLMGEWLNVPFFDFLGSLGDAKPKTVGFVSMNNPIGKAGVEGERAAVKALGIEVKVDEYFDVPLASADALMTKCKEANIELLFCKQFLPDAILTAKSCKALGYNPKAFFQVAVATSPAWTATLGADANYVFQSSAISHALPLPGIQALNAVAKEEWDQPYAPDYLLFGYSWIETLQRGVEGAGSLDQAAIRDYLRNHKISIISGDFTFDEKGLPKPYSYLLQVIDGDAKIVWPVDKQTAKPVYPKPYWGE